MPGAMKPRAWIGSSVSRGEPPAPLRRRLAPEREAEAAEGEQQPVGPQLVLTARQEVAEQRTDEEHRQADADDGPLEAGQDGQQQRGRHQRDDRPAEDVEDLTLQVLRPHADGERGIDGTGQLLDGRGQQQHL